MSWFMSSFISPGRCGGTGTTRSGRVARGGVGGLGYGADPRAGTVSFITLCIEYFRRQVLVTITTFFVYNLNI